MHRSIVMGAVLLALCLTASVPGYAAPVTIVNPSFEAQVLAPGGTVGNNDFDAPSGWTGEYGGGGVYNVSNAWGASDGSNVWIKFGGASEGGINQVLTSVLQPDTLYTYSVDVYLGNMSTTWYSGNELAVTAGSSLYTYGYNMNLSSGAHQPYGTLTNGAVPGVTTTNLGPDPLTYGQWHTVSVQFLTGATGSDPNFGAPIKLYVRIGEANGTWTAFDNVRLDATAVPEPSSIVALAGGLVTLLGIRRRIV